MEFVLGGAAAALAGVFTNPLEVTKTRIQLQGELASQNHYKVHYRNVGHALYTVWAAEGVRGLQKGLVPALCYQVIMNGVRLGLYQHFDNLGFTDKTDGSHQKHLLRSATAGAAAGFAGTWLASPFYLVKTRLQSRSAKEIAVGHQHDYSSMTAAFRKIVATEGLGGLWRGVMAGVYQNTVGSGVQLAAFALTKQWLHTNQVALGGWSESLLGTMVASVLSTACMTPLTVVSVRLYNQPADEAGRGRLYANFADCVRKMLRSEGPLAFYKGWATVFLRLGPHTVLSLSFWDAFKRIYYHG